jgi:hypothetical protein
MAAPDQEVRTITERQPDRDELRQPTDPAAKDQPAEGGRDEVEEDLRRQDQDGAAAAPEDPRQA